MQHRLAAHCSHALIEQADETGLVDRMHRAQRRHAGESSGQCNRQQRFVKLHHHRRRQSPGHVGAVPRDALGKGGRQIPYRPGIGDCPVAIGQFQLGRQCDRTGCLHLDHPIRAPCLLPCLFECVDVFIEQAARPPHHRTGARGDPVATGDGVQGDINQERAGASDQIGPHAPIGKLHQVRQLVQLADDDLGGLPRRRTRP